MEFNEARYPGRAPIDAYGNGGFRFADMSHRGSLLFLPSGVYEWRVASFDDVAVATLARLFEDADSIELLLLGCGDEVRNPPAAVLAALDEHGVAIELMTTGTAARTYNVLLAEERAVAAALVAVDNP